MTAEVISLDARRRKRGAASARLHGRSSATFFFDLACPFSYFAAERVERQFPGACWRPASADALLAADPCADPGRAAGIRRAAELRAESLGMPLVWPQGPPRGSLAAMRAAAYAADQGRGAAFVIAAGRLAFCGGFDLGDPEVLAEAAAASGIGLRACLKAAGDAGRDGAIEDAGRWLLAAGAGSLPALSIGGRVFAGEQRLGEAFAFAQGRVVA